MNLFWWILGLFGIKKKTPRVKITEESLRQELQEALDLSADLSKEIQLVHREPVIFYSPRVSFPENPDPRFVQTNLKPSRAMIALHNLWIDFSKRAESIPPLEEEEIMLLNEAGQRLSYMILSVAAGLAPELLGCNWADIDSKGFIVGFKSTAG